MVVLDTELLQEIGLTFAEQRVYLALLEKGNATRGDIVKLSGVTGSKVYELLDKLQGKGLVSIYMQNKVKHFKVTNPLQLVRYVEHKKEKMERLEKQTKQLIPGLLQLYNSSLEEQEVELVSGLQGLEVLFREQIEMLGKGETCYVIGGTRGSNEQAVQAFFEKIHLLREQKKIKTKMLFNVRQREETLRLYSSQKYPHTTTRFITHTSPVAINIFKDRTIIIIFGSKISAIAIKSADVAQSFKEYFMLVWGMGKA